MSQLVVRDLRAWISVSVDLGHFIQAADADGFITARASREWIDAASDALAPHLGQKFSAPVRLASEYARTDRAQRNTFASQHARELLPVEFMLLEQPEWQESEFRMWPVACRLSPRGAITAKIQAELRAGEWFTAQEVVDQYNHVLRRLPEVAQAAFA